MAISPGAPISSKDVNNISDAVSGGLPYRGYMGAGDHSSKDFNDYVLNGIYANGGTNQGYLNAPHGTDNGRLIVTGDGCHQLWFSELQLLPVMYRHLTNKTNKTWSAWVSLAGLNMDLLWTNSSPQSNFEVQTVSLGADFAKYKFILIYLCYNTSDTTEVSVIAHGTGAYQAVHKSGTSIVGRSMYIQTNGIKFNTALVGSTYDNSYMIPYYIYGVK